MIGNELVRELVETVICTGKLRDISPVSLLLIAEPESGKTSVVLEKECKNIRAFTDITGRGIVNVIKNNPDVTHIVINDMISVMSHKSSVNKYCIAVLNSLTEEGVMAIAGPQGEEVIACGRRGIITSLTTDMISDARSWWTKIGFTSRMLPFCFKYPENLIIKIKDSIDEVNGKTIKKDKLKFDAPSNLKNVLCAESFIKEIRYIADVRSGLNQEQGMRRLKQYHAIIQAHALLRNKNKPIVEEIDVDFLKQIDLYCSYDNPRELIFDGSTYDNGNKLSDMQKTARVGA